jgi:hypothetical protein
MKPIEYNLSNGGIMKRLVPLLIFFVLGSIYAQEVIENPKTPQNENAGRVLKLEEEFRIESEGEGYYHNGARDLRLDNSGNIYICDSWSSSQRAHLLKFSPEGIFLRDLYKQGEGPGEIQSFYDFSLNEQEVFVFDYMKRKIIVMDNEGRFDNEFKITSGRFNDFIGVFRDWLVFMRKDIPYERKTSKLYDVEDVIVFLSKDGQKEKDFYAFFSKEFYVSSAQGGGGMNWDPFMAVMGDGKLFVCHTREYLIDVLDLNTGKITTRFTRKYPRVKHEIREFEKNFSSKYGAPRKKFEQDVMDIFYDRGHVWVKTSTEDEERGMLFDVFDTEGKFLDSFYINIEGRILKIDGDFLYAAETDEDELPLIVNYRIIRGQVPN